MTKFLGIDWIPAQVPIHRRIQTTVVFFVIWIIMAPGPYIMLAIYLFFTKFWWLMAAYLVFLYLDRLSFKQGSRPSVWLRNLSFWKYFAEYFPAKLEKTVDLDPNRNYIFGCHPHGILVLGIFAHFTTYATGFTKLFPGIMPRVCTLVMNFWIPFRRDIFISLGAVDVSKESIEHQLTKMGNGNACVIVVGGAKEALSARPGDVHLVLKNRKGFAKMAIRCGADLVPVFSFGENEVFQQYEPPKDSWIYKLQQASRKYIPFTLPVFYGRGMFNYTFGFMPYRTPILTIVGEPIRVVKNPSPTAEEVDTLHATYLQRLNDIFEKNKHRSNIAEDVHLDFV